MQPPQTEVGHSVQEDNANESQEVLLQLVLPATHWEITLKGCHNEVGHLGLEWMLDLMCDHFFCPCMAAQVREHIEKCCQCIAFKAT